MEWLLIAATMVAFGLALAMSIVAWHLLRRDRERSAARIEALEAMAFDEDARERRAPVPLPAAAVPPHSPAVADMPGQSVAEPLLARPASIAASGPPVRSGWDGLLRAGTPVPERPLFDEAPAQRVAVRRSLAVAAMVVVLAGLVGGVTLLRAPLVAAFNGTGDTRAAVNGTPLELLSLRHLLDQPGTFSVTGLVQNPADARDLEHLEAVLYLFDDTGQFLTSSRAALEIPTLGPGDQSAFLVRIPTSATISRYRVGFRRADGRAVAHVDHRGRLPEGTTGDVLTVDAGDTVAPAAAVRSAADTPTSAR